MMFKVVKDAVKTLLTDAAAGRYRVSGSQKQQKSVENSIGANRLVEVFFRTENFELSKGRLNGPTHGAINIAIELTVTATAKVDLTVIENPASTPAQIQAAMANLKESSSETDDSFDELAEIIYQIMMDARNIDLGLPIGDISNRWISTINKDNPNPRGQLIVLTGILEFSCNASEDVPGDTPLPADEISFETEIENDTVQKTGINIKY